MAEKTREWIEATDQAIDMLKEWRRKLQDWQRSGCDSGEFHTALFTLRSTGLEQWADRNTAGLDALAEEIIISPNPDRGMGAKNQKEERSGGYPEKEIEPPAEFEWA